MKESLEDGALKVLHTLQQHGYQAYCVGGCVRDKMLQRTVKDYDIATSARPEQVQRLFKRTIPTGLQHGTVTVLINECTYEVTTFRKEEGYEQFRRPTEVHYIDSLFEDLKRRDFTMNAMALDKEEQLLDPFGGLDDLKQGILRCVGVAEERFKEDALRMLRCIRFASEYHLTIEEQTWQSLCDNAPLLKYIAMERVRMELERMIGGASPNRALALLSNSRLLQYTKKELTLSAIRTVDAFQPMSALLVPSSRWAYIYLKLGSSVSQTEKELRRLTFSKQQLEDISSIVAAAYDLGKQLSVQTIAVDEKRSEHLWKRAALKFGTSSLLNLRSILFIDETVGSLLGLHSSICMEFTCKGIQWLNDLPVTRLAELQLTGKDLLEHLNRPPGPWMADVLQHLLAEAALGLTPNEREALLTEARQWVGRHIT